MSKIFAVLSILTLCHYRCDSLRGPPVVEKAPLLLNSYVPACMQVIAHYTDLMKYDIKPVEVSTTSTTIRPTPSHNPAIYSPHQPPGPSAYFTRQDAYKEYVERLHNYQGYFLRYQYPGERQEQLKKKQQIQKLPEDLDLLGIGPSQLLQKVNTIEDNDFEDEDDQILKFTDDYDDFGLRGIIVGMKKPPPVKAYVTLLSLYDLLNQESKKLQLNKYGGYSEEVLKVLMETSNGTAADQLRVILKKIVEYHNTNDPKILKNIATLREDLEVSNSYLNDALRYIPPLPFLL